MGIFDGVDDIGRQPSRRCAVAVLTDQLDPEDSAALLAVAKNRNVPASVIRDRLATAGYEITKDALWRHRRGDCRCDRKVAKT